MAIPYALHQKSRRIENTHPFCFENPGALHTAVPSCGDVNDPSRERRAPDRVTNRIASGLISRSFSYGRDRTAEGHDRLPAPGRQGLMPCLVFSKQRPDGEKEKNVFKNHRSAGMLRYTIRDRKRDGNDIFALSGSARHGFPRMFLTRPVQKTAAV